MKQKVALVLGSGGARGITHIGVIRELIAQDFEITSIAGSSMGAMVGGIYAAGKLDEYEKWITSLNKKDVFNLMDFTLSKNGIMKANRVLDEMKTFISDINIEELPIKFCAVATDIKNKKEVVISEGSLYNAVRASISIPAVFTPLEIDNYIFIDGGVLNPVPVNRVYRNEGDILIAVDVNAQIPYPKLAIINADLETMNKPIRKIIRNLQKKLSYPTTKKKEGYIGYFNIINGTSKLMVSQISKLTLEMNPPDLLIEISNNSCNVFDFYKATELIELGKKITKNNTEKLTKLKNNTNY